MPVCPRLPLTGRAREPDFDRCPTLATGCPGPAAQADNLATWRSRSARWSCGDTGLRLMDTRCEICLICHFRWERFRFRVAVAVLHDSSCGAVSRFPGDSRYRRPPRRRRPGRGSSPRPGHSARSCRCARRGTVRRSMSCKHPGTLSHQVAGRGGVPGAAKPGPLGVVRLLTADRRPRSPCQALLVTRLRC